MPNTSYELFPSTGFTVTHFLVSADIKKSLDFYSRILGGKVVMDGENGKPCVVQLENTWVIINVGGGPTDDKPGVYLAPPKDGEAVSSFMNIRVANIAECYDTLERSGCGVPHRTEGPRGRDAVLHARSRRTPHRGRRGEKVAASREIEPARMTAWSVCERQAVIRPGALLCCSFCTRYVGSVQLKHRASLDD